MEDRCVVCGALIPEGLQVCAMCTLASGVERDVIPHVIVLKNANREPPSRDKRNNGKAHRRFLWLPHRKT